MGVMSENQNNNPDNDPSEALTKATNIKDAVRGVVDAYGLEPALDDEQAKTWVILVAKNPRTMSDARAGKPLAPKISSLDSVGLEDITRAVAKDPLRRLNTWYTLLELTERADGSSSVAMTVDKLRYQDPEEFKASLSNQYGFVLGADGKATYFDVFGEYPLEQADEIDGILASEYNDNHPDHKLEPTILDKMLNTVNLLGFPGGNSLENI